MAKDKLLQVRVDDIFIEKLDYLRNINAYKSYAEAIRKLVEKECRKEGYNGDSRQDESAEGN